jgi:septum formation protein
MVGLVLASGSPRRLELLRHLRPKIEVRRPDVDERPLEGERPMAYVERLAVAKAAEVAAQLSGPIELADSLIVAADTAIDLDGQILGKPTDRPDARRMLAALSGRTHRVHTGVALMHRGEVARRVVSAEVDVVALRPSDIEWYLATGEADDKAGAYALQGAAGAFVRAVRGSVSGVIGLPLVEVVDLAAGLGVDLPG